MPPTPQIIYDLSIDNERLARELLQLKQACKGTRTEGRDAKARSCSAPREVHGRASHLPAAAAKVPGRRARLGSGPAGCMLPALPLPCVHTRVHTAVPRSTCLTCGEPPGAAAAL